MIEHTGVPVSDLARAKEFYGKAIAPLGYEEKHDWGEAIGYMEGGHSSFFINRQDTVVPTHLAFRAHRKEDVDAFHAAALAAGGEDNGAPGYRTDYSPGYYAAFIHDPDGNNIEAVWFDPQKEEAG